MSAPRAYVPPSNQATSTWKWGAVDIAERGYEKFKERDLPVIQWLNLELQDYLDTGNVAGSNCYHLKHREGIKGAIADTEAELTSGRYPYVIRSDAKGYDAHIRHHKLVGLLRSNGMRREVCHVVTQLCQRMVVHRGIYSECQQGIPLGCAASPALDALYLSPLDDVMQSLAGVKYIRYMDDWVILCESRWKMRRAVRLMHQTLYQLGLYVHPDKTFIGRVSKGFDFLGVQFSPTDPRSKLQSCLTKFGTTIHPSPVTSSRLNSKLSEKFSSCVRFYEQGKLRNLSLIERYLTHWLRWAKSIGIASSIALEAIEKRSNDYAQTQPAG